MTSMEAQLTIDPIPAQLFSKLSGRPAHVSDDIFVWNDVILSRDLAIVLLLKANNNVPINSAVRKQLYTNYIKRFSDHPLTHKVMGEEFNLSNNHEAWFNSILRRIIREFSENTWSADNIKEILTVLHS